VHERTIHQSRRKPAMEPRTMPAMAPPLSVFASVGDSFVPPELCWRAASRPKEEAVRGAMAFAAAAM
jgi:hypothetical protein